MSSFKGRAFCSSSLLQETTVGLGTVVEVQFSISIILIRLKVCPRLYNVDKMTMNAVHEICVA